MLYFLVKTADFRSWVITVPRKQKYSTEVTGEVKQGDGSELLWMSTIISTVFGALSFSLFVLHQVVSLPPIGRLIIIKETFIEGKWCLQTSGAWQTDDWRCSGVQREMERGHSLGGIGCWGSGSQWCFPCFTLLSDRTLHLQVESGMLSWESLFCRRVRLIVLKAELKSAVRILS